MPTFNSSIPTLILLADNVEPKGRYGYRQERKINREVLLDVAPDRETLIASDKSIHELRQKLKIRITSPAVHWLYRTQRLTDVDVKDPPITRISAFVREDSEALCEGNSIGPGPHIIRHRGLSTTSISPSPMSTIENRFNFVEDYISIWGAPTLSTGDRLISPRLLGPTHILVVHEISDLPRFIRTGDRGKVLRQKQGTALFLSQVIELPINDLLFILNVPNLPPTIPALPRRLHKELPRVLMYAPHLDTFEELVVYLHTKNQAELFRKIVPEWIRDLAHPFPSLAGEAVADFKTKNPIRNSIHFFGMLALCSNLDSKFDSGSAVSVTRSSKSKGIVDLIAGEIAEVAHALSIPPGGCDADPLIYTVSRLNALHDNLRYVGYFEKDLWNELNSYREILIRAVSCKAKIEGDVGSG